ncbi:Phosphoinositide phosphatase SAC3 [Camellia lanceoleosa]|uniref:Phosphoinositide phosphatase SAC3 n=1 Tax=Camellia lanceoleosa TaxID=1840588 RepID=A0ACC0HMB8_9ERIC|nr:Phosphoinositide phosphatase SAC3 [Camellia lanceoleosa]
MGIPSTMRDAWANRRYSPLIASPAEDQKILNSRRCTQEGVRAGVKAASIACVGDLVPHPLPDKTQGLSVSTPEISPIESELSYSRYTPFMSSRQLFLDMQPNHYLENDRVCLDGLRDSFHCSNFWDVDWLSSSRNSCEEETYER